MPTVLYVSFDPEGSYGTAHFSASAVETCLEVLTLFAANGWMLERVELVLDEHKKPLVLPVTLFDGESFIDPIIALEKEWKLLLAT